jgi:catechol 2,3-dioxygenase-like lactoylglutathione lyase family enzyme
MPEWHIGRLIDHIHLRARDLAASKRFYRAARCARQTDQRRRRDLQVDELWIDALGNDRLSARAWRSGSRYGCRATLLSRLAAGGRDNGAR